MVYVFPTVVASPDRSSLPDQRYVYVPDPNSGVTLHVTGTPVCGIAVSIEHDTRKDSTVVVAEAVALPPEPVQETAYAVVAVGVTVTEPDVAFPVLKFVPVQLDALVDDHVMSADSPTATLVGLDTIPAVTAGP